MDYLLDHSYYVEEFFLTGRSHAESVQYILQYDYTLLYKPRISYLHLLYYIPITTHTTSFHKRRNMECKWMLILQNVQCLTTVLTEDNLISLVKS